MFENNKFFRYPLSDFKVDDYIHIRLTMPHDKARETIPHICKGMPYVAYFHSGAPEDGQPHRPHAHVFVCSTKVDMLRKRVKDNTGLKGNGGYACTEQHNGIQKGIQYGTHEKTDPMYSPGMEWYIWEAPVWDDKQKNTPYEPKAKDVERDRFVLNYNNVVFIGAREAKSYNHKDWTLPQAVNHFRDRVECTFAYNLAVHGLPQVYHDEYAARLGKRKRDTNWADFRY